MAVDVEVEEVRIALALNGGVSLAVWMGGCAVELDRARRTSASGDDISTYGALCRALRRELVIDVMTGSSAGGINGGLLAAAMTTNGSLDAGFVRNRWLELGDFAKLMQPLSNGRPESLMQGDYFANELVATFRQVMGGRSVTGLCPALDITTTDLAGTPLQFRDDWGGTLHAREHRIRFRFRKPAHYQPETLAAAARASASFPMAFEPFELSNESTADIEALAAIGSRRWVIDGGLLDNAPIRAALNLIPARPAARQVKRYLCYLNGDPAGGRHSDADTDRPHPVDVGGAIVNLPRNAPFADHLLAVQDLRRRSGLTLEIELALLELDIEALEATAQGLLPTYRARRRLAALHDVLTEPGEAKQAFDNLEKAGLELPWIPLELTVPADGEWRWGFQTSRRAQQLALDLIRASLPNAMPEHRRRLLDARQAIDQRASAIDADREDFAEKVREAFRLIAKGENVSRAVETIESAVRGERPSQRAAVIDTGRDLYGVADLLGTPHGFDLRRALFGRSPATASEEEFIAEFLRRTLAIEVVRRSFLDQEPIDDGQEIAFAQLTPEAPDLLFTSRPLSERRKPTADSKLCGTLLGHFSGFFRRSWRANDFLWGRLDAASRITYMLASAARTQALANTDQEQPWIALSRDLSGRSVEHDALIEEALADAGIPAGPPLADRLHDALRDDLTTGDGQLTRVIAGRAAQFEALQDELRHVVDEATKDFALGSSRDTLGLEGLDLRQPSGVLEAVKRLREKPERTFPQRLGRVGGAELSSDLGVRTGAHAGLVGLAMARHAGGAPATPLTPLRSVLLPIAGAVSGRIRSRAAVVVAFWAATMYLAARVAGLDDDSPANLGTVALPELALAFVGWLVIVGTVLVPALRAKLRHGIPRAWAGFAAAGIAVSGGAAGGLVALGGPLTWDQLVVAAGAPDPPTWVIAGPLALGAGVVLGPRLLRRTLKESAEAAWHGTLSLLATYASATIVLWWSWDNVIGGLDGSWWQQTSAVAALVVGPGVALSYFVGWPVVKGRLRQL